MKPNYVTNVTVGETLEISNVPIETSADEVMGPLESSLNARSKDGQCGQALRGTWKGGGYPGAGLFCGRRLGGWGGRGGGVALPSGTPGWAGLLCWLKASITLGVFATGGGGVGARGSVERE